MATTHVFIVDKTTFKLHLEYLFAGTGAKDYKINFNNKKNSELHHTKEDLLVKMISDIERIRKGDFIIFYLQQNTSDKIFEGKFYGVFKVKEKAFLDNNDKHQFLKNELNKSLTFRILIEPYKVYKQGVSEWEALDEIKNISSPCQMIWSLIYRKLKGNRGNTMITIYESERLIKLLKDKNENKEINSSFFSFDLEKQEIVPIDSEKKYNGRKEEINLLKRIKKKFIENKSFESHLQAYILKNIGIDKNLNRVLSLNNGNIEWIGNEVSCGVGMQRIDICLGLKITEQERIIMPIELKAVEISQNDISQIRKYIKWIEQYYIPNRISEIKPFFICKKERNKQTEKFEDIIKLIKEFRKETNLNLELIEFDFEKENLVFEKYKI